MTRVLVARLDSAGDVLLTGPAVRAVAATAEVVMWCSPRGAAAARLLPGVTDVLVAGVEWIGADPAPVDPDRTHQLVDRLRDLAVDQAAVLTSFHQPSLPTALLCRLAGIPVVAAVSEANPGSLLDVRHRVADDLHEVRRNLSLVATLGHRLPAGDDGGLAVRGPLPPSPVPRPYVVVHPGAADPARAWHPDRSAAAVEQLRAHGWHVAVTGGPDEVALTRHVAATGDPGVIDLGGATDLAGLAGVLADADAVVTGNTGPAHLAAAVRTPVVSLYAPTVPATRWRPWGVPHELLGDLDIACAGCRARTCPVPGHPCIDTVRADAVVAAVRRLLADRDRLPPAEVVHP